MARNFTDVIVISAAYHGAVRPERVCQRQPEACDDGFDIGNEITAENQCRLFDKLLRQDVAFFGDRHSSEFSARISNGASSVSNVLAILITAIGRDALTLGGLLVVMVARSPGLSLIGVFVMVPAVLTVRHLIRRVRQLAQKGYGGGALVLETLQESVQGIRVVKALGLEGEMRDSLRASVVAVQQAANKLARVVNRSTPLMEALAGAAVGLVLMYGGYRVIFQNGTPGEFVSFIAAFLLAYEPGKRLARLNVDLSGALVGVSVLLDILDLPDRVDESAKPALKVDRGRMHAPQAGLRLPSERARAAPSIADCRAGPSDRAGRAVRRRQNNNFQPAAPLLQRPQRGDHD